MSFEQSKEYFERTQLTPEERCQAMLRDMFEIAQIPDEDLQVEAAYYASVLSNYEADPKFQMLINDFVAVRTDLSITHLRYMTRSSVQKIAKRIGYQYPRGFDDKLEWDYVISDILRSDELFAEVEFDLHTRHLQTNIPDRYKSAAITANWAQANGRLLDGVVLFDFGTGRLLGPKNMALLEINRETNGRIFHDFGNTVVVEPKDSSDITRAHTVVSNDTLTRGANIAQSRPIGLVIGNGYDIEDLDLPGNREWAQSNLTPGEHADGTAALLNMLEESTFNRSNTALENVRLNFLHGDILLGGQLDHIDVYESNYPDNYESAYADMTLLYTVLNQFSEQQVRTAFKRARRYTKPTGLIIIQDFARVIEDAPAELEFLDSNWNQNYSYRTILFDMMNPYGFQEIMRWDGGRARKMNIPYDKNGEPPRIVAAEGYRSVDLRTYLGRLALAS